MVKISGKIVALKKIFFLKFIFDCAEQYVGS